MFFHGDDTDYELFTCDALRRLERRSVKKIRRTPNDQTVAHTPSKSIVPAKPVAVLAGAKALVKVKPLPKPQDGQDSDQTASTSCSAASAA